MLRIWAVAAVIGAAAVAGRTGLEAAQPVPEVAQQRSDAAPGRPEAPVVYDLTSAVDTAIRNHPALAAAAARRQAATTRTTLVGAQYRPFVEGFASVGGTLAGDRTVFFREEFAARGFESNPFYTAALRFILPVFREATSPFTTLPSEIVARAAQAGTQHAERLARVETIGNATMAFYSMLAVRDEVAATREGVDLTEALYESTQRRYQQQLIPQVEVFGAEAALAAARADLGTATANLAKARELFALALGLEPSAERTGGLDVVDTREARPPVASFDDLLKQLNTSHPSVLVQQEKVKEAEAAVAVLRTQRYPTLDAGMAIGAVDDFSVPVEGWSLRAFLRLNWNIYDFGVLSLRIKEQSQLAEAERRTLDQVRSQLAQNLSGTYGHLAASRTRLESSEKAVDATTEEVRVAERRQQQGLAPSEELLKARLRLLAARRALAQARYAVLVDEAAVKVAAGAE